jgi:HD-like signal output (HDOD) protein
MTTLSEADAARIIGGIKLPPRPVAMAAIAEEKLKDAPDFRRIAREIGNDVGLAAAVLKTVNSPLFGPARKITSIDQAIAMLGLSNIDALVAGLSLRAAVPCEGLQQFWDSSMRTAMACAWLAQRLRGVARESAHLFGLFHDCGIPLLLARFPDYGETLRMAGAGEGLLIELENARHGTNHVVVGQLLASNWQLPDTLRQAIGLHHEPDLFNDTVPRPVRSLIALARIAEAMEEQLTGTFLDAEWPRFERAVLGFLDLGEQEFAELRDDLRDLLSKEG